MNDAQKQIHESRLSDGRLPAHTSIGCYPIWYLAADGGCLCATCATSDGQMHDDSDPQWHLIGCDVHWEGEPLTCDHCGDDIESAYGSVDGSKTATYSRALDTLISSGYVIGGEIDIDANRKDTIRDLFGVSPKQLTADLQARFAARTKAPKAPKGE